MQDFPIKNIIFDLGGVILNIDTQLTFDAFRRIGIESFEKSEESIELFINLEKGASTPELFRDHIRKLSGVPNSDEEIDTAWTAMLLDIPADRVDYLEMLKKKYRIFLLSNTNEIHRRKFHREFEQFYGYPFSQLFEKNHYSHLMGLRKPDIEIFRKVLEENRLIAGETLFIDDIRENVTAAESIGIKGLHIDPGTLLAVLPVYLNGAF